MPRTSSRATTSRAFQSMRSRRGQRLGREASIAISDRRKNSMRQWSSKDSSICKMKFARRSMDALRPASRSKPSFALHWCTSGRDSSSSRCCTIRPGIAGESRAQLPEAAPGTIEDDPHDPYRRNEAAGRCAKVSIRASSPNHCWGCCEVSIAIAANTRPPSALPPRCCLCSSTAARVNHYEC